MASLKQLQSQAVSLYRSIEKRSRLLHADKIKLGKLLLTIRQGFAAERGRKTLTKGPGGTMFTTWLEDSGITVSIAYSYMGLAKTGKWKLNQQNWRKRVVYWSKFTKQIQSAQSNAEKVKMLRTAVEYLKTTYDIRAKVTIR